MAMALARGTDERFEDALAVIVAGAGPGTLAAPYATSRGPAAAKRRRIVENAEGLHDLVRASLRYLRSRSAAFAPAPPSAGILDARSALGAAVAAAVGADRRSDGSDGAAAAERGAAYDLGDVADRLLVAVDETRFSVGGRACVARAASATLLGDCSRWARPLLRRGRTYDVIVADPPWPSRSAARRGLYATGGRDWRGPLRRFPARRLAAPTGALVGVWATNDAKVERFVREDLFKKWGVAFVGRWYWLKVADGLVPAVPIDEAAERKPWEVLVVGVLAGAAGAAEPVLGGAEPLGATASRLDAGDAARRARWRRPGAGAGELDAVPETLVFAGPPGSHSAKPRLDALFRACFAGGGAEPPAGLELFGRASFEGWTAAGDQALPLAPPGVGDG